MGNASFVQTSFLGGEWSPRAQGRMTDPQYKTAMGTCYNAFPTEEGAWVRRPGFRYLAHTRGGQAAKIAAFDFSVTQPYQLEFTNLKGRLFAGLSLLTTLNEDGAVEIFYVSPTNPAKVYLSTPIPSGWANGDTVVFNLQSVPATMPELLNRQFVVANIDTTNATFTLQDPFTGTDIDATGYTFTTYQAGETFDTVEKVFEFTTVYPTSLLPDLRLVTNDTTVTILSGAYRPYLLKQGAPWTITIPDFTDGPYLDVNPTSADATPTTLAPSALTGAIYLVASSTLGINDGRGFQATDLGRLIRFQSSPATWTSGITYVKDDYATGSDTNIYRSLAGTNVGHDPTTDDGTHWIVTSEEITWTWMKITSVTNTVQVNVTIMGVDLPSTTPSKIWRLGLYSDTTAWPTCGCYHEGRLWLSSTAFGNRVDGSYSNDPYNFTPTSVDGTVSAANAVDATANANDVNAFFWMISTEDGLVLGSQSGEWRVRASSLDDPISPTSIQMRRVSTWGCANVEPVQASLNVFVQRQRRKLLAHISVNDLKYSAENLSHLSDHLIAPGIEEIRWQQEPPLTIWSRLANGGLTGTVFQKGYNTWSRTGGPEDSFGAFFGVGMGDGRTVESISTGPTYDGLSTTLYVVSNQTDSTAPDYGIRWVQCMMPTFDSSTPDWAAYLMDGGANPTYAKRCQIANGDSFDGIRIFGLWNSNGMTITPVIGGLDLGDHAVTGGHMDVSFGSDPAQAFTSTFFTGQSDGTDYNVFASQAGYVTHANGGPAPVPANYLMAYVGTDGVVTGSYDGMFHIDAINNRCFEVLRGTGTNNGARIFNMATGNQITSAAPTTSFAAINGVNWTGSVTDVFQYGTYVVYLGNLYQKISVYSDTDIALPPSTNPFRWADCGPAPSQPDWRNCSVSFLHSNGFIYAQVANTLFDTIYKINATTLEYVAVAGCHDAYGSTNRSGAHYEGNVLLSIPNGQPSFSSATAYAEMRVTNTGTGHAGLNTTSYQNYIAYCGRWAAGKANEVVIVEADTLTFVGSAFLGDVPPSGLSQTALLDEDAGTICSAPTATAYNTIFLAGKPYAMGIGGSQTVGLYRASIGRLASTDTGGRTQRVGRICKVEPADINPIWTAWKAVHGPIFDRSDSTIIMVYSGTDATQGDRMYVVKHHPATGAILWSTYWVAQGTYYLNDQVTSVMDVRGRLVLMSASSSTHQLEIVDTSTGAHTTQIINSYIYKNIPNYWDPTTSSVTFFGSYAPTSGSLPTVTTIGDYLPAHGDTLSGQWGRFYAGLTLDPTTTTTTYSIPLSMGSTYTSRGQILRPDFGPDAGAQNGPAFGKLRRLHKWAASFWKSRGLSLGTTFDKMFPIIMRTPGKSVIPAPTLYSGIISDTINCDDGFDAQIAWEVTRPYPVTILAMGGYISSTDK